ncbi:hypothetical protein JY651_00800 [Pyxidicoccus parkwayensis]|uniref:Uncharacterized protein n=1 Tax=Pyxidicoccus parkwayensis TaxID=2813578 RepID=A0ABX7NYP6_9BACT|nr:hypothetical protein [Pyxidicoccus parkwaysis]QSQ23556.1 hypothetical protein JY651_00800 [Pyxidicoccus parkwaysis]
MNRRDLLSALLALPLASLVGCASHGTRAPASASTFRTRWRIAGSEGMDALCFLNALSGDAFYARYYADELARFSPGFSANAVTTLQQLMASSKEQDRLMGPFLCLVFSAGPTATLADLRGALANAETQLLPGFRASPYWDAPAWDWVLTARPALTRVLEALEVAGFPRFRRDVIGAQVEQRAAALRQRLAGVDVIAEQERLLGRKLEEDIAIDLMHFSKPHGIKVIGQRFLTHLTYSDELVIRNAAHEILHPPFDVEHPAIRAAMEVLQRDPLLTRIVADHDPSFGYTTLEGLFDEDTAEALEQLINERLGVAVPARERWRRADDGMHVLAAGLYGLLKADGFERTGGVIQEWLGRAAREGRLAPESLHAAAASVLELPAERLWAPPAKP